MKAKNRYIILTALILIFGFLIYSVYNDVREQTINEFNNQQMLLAKQAATSIENLFEVYENELTCIAGINDIINFNENGETLLRAYFSYNKNNINAVTRVDTSGKIIFSIPENSDLTGVDISYQMHVAEILQSHEPVMSDVFMAVQNFKAIAYHVPVFKQDKFNGTLAILIKFDSITRKYLENIKTGKNGYAWMLSKQGIELYCPVPGHTGKPIKETSDNFDSVLRVAEKMINGEEGTTSYFYGNINEKRVDNVKKHAAYTPVKLRNTFWSICIATPEDEVLATMTGLKNKLFLITAFLLLTGILVTYYLLKAAIVLIEEKKRKNIENALRASEQQFRSYVDNAPDGIFVFRPNGDFIDVNKAFCNITGYTFEELLSLAFLDLIPIENQQKANDFFEELRKNNNSSMDVYFLNKDRMKKYTSIDAVKLEDDKYLAFIRDITEKKHLEDQFRQSQKMEAIGHLAGGIAHDFNNLLTIINGYSEMLIEFPDSKSRNDDLKQIIKAGKRAEALTGQLLAFSRKQVLQPKVLNLNKLISESNTLLQRLIGENIELSVNYQNDLRNIKADPSQLEQVILNLVINSRDAMPQGGRLIIETKNTIIDVKNAVKNSELAKGEYVLLSFTDTGVGMDKDIIGRIFDPFFTTKEEGKGTGLGLSTAYGIVKQSGGNIVAQSEPGKGSTFTIYFQAVDESISAEPDRIPDNQPESKTDTILVVEDEDAVRELTVRSLEKYGYRVLAASGGSEALELLKTWNAPVRLLLTDVIMPGLSGQEVAESVIQIFPEIEVLFMSGYTGDTIGKHGVFDEFTNFISKPFTPAKLIKKIREMLT